MQGPNIFHLAPLEEIARRPNSSGGWGIQDADLAHLENVLLEHPDLAREDGN